MKKYILLLAFACGFGSAWAQGLPKWAGKAKKAVFSVITYNKENKILNTGNGFYIDEKGTAVSDFTLFKGAHHAVVVTADGKELPVNAILGANDIYDVIKFRTEINKKSVALIPASQAVKTGESVYLLPYSTQKETAGKTGSVSNVDSIANNSFYYTLNMKTGAKTISCPLMNVNGEVVGLIQKNADDESEESFALGIGYAKELGISALSGNDEALNSIEIKKALPEEESQALVMLYMMASGDTNKYFEMLNDFIAQFPNSSEGYLRRGTYYMDTRKEENVKLAENDFEQMFKLAEKPEEMHHSLGRLLYSYNITLGDKKPLGSWTLDRAADEVNKALEISKAGLYYQTLGDIYFAQAKYAEAATAYEAVCKSEIASAASFFSVSKSKEMIEGTDKKELIALLDSAVAKYQPPYGSDAAPFLYERARLKSEAEDFRGAVIDYNLFHEAMLGQVTAEFYVIREQVEMQCRMYQQAINDINKAIEMAPENVEYWNEKGGIHLRLNQMDEAILALQKAISLDPKHAAAYRMLGYCQIQKKDKKVGLANLKKAQELGDEVAPQLIKKYK